MPHEPEVMGSNTARCRAFFSISFLLAINIGGTQNKSLTQELRCLRCESYDNECLALLP